MFTTFQLPVTLTVMRSTMYMADGDNMSDGFRQQDNTIRSVIFTGICGYSIGVLCLLCGIIYGGFLVTNKFYSKSDGGRSMMKVFPSSYKSCDHTIIPLAILLTILAIVVSGLVLAGSARFHSEAKNSAVIIIKTANEASENHTQHIRSIERYLQLITSPCITSLTCNFALVRSFKVLTSCLVSVGIITKEAEAEAALAPHRSSSSTRYPDKQAAAAAAAPPS
ncbi:hypothetical protein RIF29_27950 [Crotalaria pallida]|uniref:Uncharacterized protein n=1 Tax=Crotalaria pallida TaxID=3830 RepID=A0AAN9ER16_CROPI